MSEGGTRPSPYVGPRPFDVGERLYGRDREVSRLFDLLLAERIVLLYSPSGAGKSSLLNAGLIPRLREEGFVIRPTVRVGMEPPEGAPEGVTRHVLGALLSLEQDVPGDSELELARLCGHTLATYLEHRRAADGDAPEVLIVDQFEEIVTVAPTAIEAKRAFFAQLGEALRDERLWLVVSMREDFIAGLDPYRDALPTGLRTTFRLDLLGREAALAAIQGPAAAAGVAFQADAADKLVNDLRQVRMQRVDGAVETQLGPHVEPVQLQVVCQSLWSRLRPDERAIGREHIERLGDVDAALATYYDAQVEAAARRSRVPERVLRQWIGRHLVTANGLRAQVLQTPTSTQGLDNTALAALVDAHLLRTDTRRGMTWFELSHDRIVRPLQESNAAWFAAKLSPVQRQAELWDSRGRPEGLLLATDAEAEKLLAVDEERSAVEGAFLEHSRRVRRREAAARRSLRSLRALTVAVVVLVLAGLVVGLVTIRRAGEHALKVAKAEAKAAEARQREAEAELTHQLIAQVALHREQQPELAALLAVAGSRRLDDRWHRTAALLTFEVTAPQLVARLSPVAGDSADPRGRANASHPRKVVAARGELLALDRGGQVWTLTIDDRGAAPLLPAEVKAVDVAMHPGAPLLAIGRAGGTITLWDEAAGAERGSIALPGDAESRDDRAWVEGLAFSADGRSLLAVRMESQRVPLGFVVEPATGVVRRIGPLTPNVRSTSDLGLSADGAMVVLSRGTVDGAIIVFSGDPFERSPKKAACEGLCPMHVARFHPSGSTLVTGGEEALALWEVGDGGVGAASRVVRLAGEAVRDMMYMRDGKVAVLSDVRVSLWDGATLEPWGTPIELAAGDAQSLAEAGAHGELLAAAFAADAPVHVFDPRRLAPVGVTRIDASMIHETEEAPFMHGRVLAAIDGSGARVATTEYDGGTKTGRVTLFDVADQGQRERSPALAGEQFAALRVAGARVVVADVVGRISAWEVGAEAWTTLATLPAQDGLVALGVDDGGRVVGAGASKAGVELASEADGFSARARLGERAPTAIGFDRGGRQVAIAACVEQIRPNLCSVNHIDVVDVAAPAGAGKRLVVDFDPRRIVFAADGRRLAASGDRQLRVWDLEGGPIALTVRRDLGSFNGLDLSADGRILAASAVGRNAAVDVVLWDLATGEELVPPLRVHNPAIGGTQEGQVVLAGDGGLLVSSACDGAVLWSIDDDALRGRACALARRELTPAEQARFLGARRPYEALCPDFARGR